MVDIKKCNLGFFPTPLEEMRNLEKLLGREQLYIKRDDLNGLGLSGNKVRKLEYLARDAMDQGCTALLTYGGPQTNHGRLTVAAAVKLGMKAILILSGTRPDYGSGNLILDSLMGADIYFTEGNPEEKARQVMERYAQQGEKVYEIPVGGSNELGVLGYTFMIPELMKQFREQGISPKYLVTGSGSLGTFCGLWLGSKYFGANLEIIPIGVNPTSRFRETDAVELINRTSQLYQMGVVCREKDIRFNLDYAGIGYNVPDPETQEAMRILACTEAIFVDPCYTGKSFCGYLDLVKNHFEPDAGAVYLHTGGIPAIWTKEHLDAMQGRFWK